MGINEVRREIRLQDVVFKTNVEIESTMEMYYRGPGVLTREDGSVALHPYKKYDFFTYFNAVSREKWLKYTAVEAFKLVLTIRGHFEIALTGRYKVNSDYQQEIFGRYEYDCPDFQTIELAYPQDAMSQLIAFTIQSKKEPVEIKAAFYAAVVPERAVRTPYLAMVTTTFKKEEYVRRNIRLLTQYLFSDEEFRDNICWNIVDNGRTFKDRPACEQIRVFPNKNVGGAGGFARGMMESLKQAKKPTHILLMDDDVVFSPESFKRLYRLLSLVKDEYKDYFVSGAMLKMGQPNIQHEDTGMLNPKGYHQAVKPNFDLTEAESIIDNEAMNKAVGHQYAAWWFCCIPVGIARLDNLPLPVFVRGDDVEYSLRNKAQFITMNGLCIWHEGFEGKFSSMLEFYQVNRNELAVQAMHPELQDVRVIDNIKHNFWEQLQRFNYKGCELLLDAVEDFLKGPDFFYTLDGEACMKEKRAKDNKLLPMTDEVRAMIDEKLYIALPLSGLTASYFGYFVNDQKLPGFLAGKKRVAIPYGWGYDPKKLLRAGTVYAVDVARDAFVEFKRDQKQYSATRARYEQLMKRYDEEYEQVSQAYQDAQARMTSQEFWEEYLK